MCRNVLFKEINRCRFRVKRIHHVGQPSRQNSTVQTDHGLYTPEAYRLKDQHNFNIIITFITKTKISCATCKRLKVFPKFSNSTISAFIQFSNKKTGVK